jgi:hypothetical protein
VLFAYVSLLVEEYDHLRQRPAVTRVPCSPPRVASLSSPSGAAPSSGTAGSTSAGTKSTLAATKPAFSFLESTSAAAGRETRPTAATEPNNIAPARGELLFSPPAARRSSTTAGESASSASVLAKGKMGLENEKIKKEKKRHRKKEWKTPKLKEFARLVIYFKRFVN